MQGVASMIEDGALTIDAQMLFNALIVLAASFGGWILNRIVQKLDNLDRDVRNTREEYVAKLDYRDDLQGIERKFNTISDRLGKIFDKLDNKADKQ